MTRAPGVAHTPARVAAAWAVHLLTASSAPAGLLAIFATIHGEVQAAFLWMGYTIAIDAIDGTLARAVRVKEVLPFVDGAKLDDVVDYFTYVIVPAFFIVHTRLLPEAAAVPVACLVVVASGYGFAQTAAKTPDHFFTGFPSYWNLVAFYLYVLGWPPALNAAVLVVFAILVFVPLRYAYPSRMTELRTPTILLGVAWGVLLVYAVLRLPTASDLVTWSLLYPVYYFAISLYLHARRGA